VALLVLLLQLPLYPVLVEVRTLHLGQEFISVNGEIVIVVLLRLRLGLVEVEDVMIPCLISSFLLPLLGHGLGLLQALGDLTHLIGNLLVLQRP
jgi:hypothetical protein